MSKKIKILFTLSILANLLLIGFLAGHELKQFHEKPWDELAREASPETAELIHNTFRDGWKDFGPLVKEARAVKARMVEVLSAEKLDPKAFDTVINDMKVVKDKMSALRINNLKKISEQVSQEERRKLAIKFTDTFFERGSHGKKGNFGDKPAKEEASDKGNALPEVALESKDSNPAESDKQTSPRKKIKKQKLHKDEKVYDENDPRYVPPIDALDELEE